MMAAGSTRTFERGAILFTEGDPSEYVLVVLSGQLKLTKSTVDGHQVLLEIRRTGDLIGELAAIDGQPRSAAAHAIDPLTVLSIPASVFRGLLAQHPELALAVMTILAAKIRLQASRRTEAAASDALVRVCQRLAELADSSGMPMDGGEIHLSSLTQQELANWLGLSRERVAQTLRDLRESGWVTTGRRDIVIHDLVAIRELGRG